jgi:hypothetical protein
MQPLEELSKSIAAIQMRNCQFELTLELSDGTSLHFASVNQGGPSPVLVINGRSYPSLPDLQLSLPPGITSSAALVQVLPAVEYLWRIVLESSTPTTLENSSSS